MTLQSVYPEATWIFDIEVFDEFGDGHWAQARFLVHLRDDVLWTSDPKIAAQAIEKALRSVSKEKNCEVKNSCGVCVFSFPDVEFKNIVICRYFPRAVSKEKSEWCSKFHRHPMKGKEYESK